MSHSPNLSTEGQELLRKIVSKYLPDDTDRLLGEPPDKWIAGPMA